MNDQVPIEELLRGVPKEHRLEIEINSMHHRMIPVGVYCHNAAAELTRLRLQLDATDRELAARGKDISALKECIKTRERQTEIAKEGLRHIKNGREMYSCNAALVMRQISKDTLKKMEAGGFSAEQMRQLVRSFKAGWHEVVSGRWERF